MQQKGKKKDKIETISECKWKIFYEKAKGYFISFTFGSRVLENKNVPCVCVYIVELQAKSFTRHQTKRTKKKNGYNHHVRQGTIYFLVTQGHLFRY